ncbi:MAG TPA: GAP family protein [Chloroflexota bacterium]|nr:GAP family protein [Chloroflexota bacterium]
MCCGWRSIRAYGWGDAALVIARANPLAGQVILALAVFIGMGSITVAGPVLYYLVAGERAAKTLDGWKAWLTANNATVRSPSAGS